MPEVTRQTVPTETAAAAIAGRLRANRCELGQLLDAGLREIGPGRLRPVVEQLGISEAEATRAVTIARDEGAIR